jgi:hypothetical protein
LFVFTEDTWDQVDRYPARAMPEVVHHANTTSFHRSSRCPKSGHIGGAFEPGARGTSHDRRLGSRHQRRYAAGRGRPSAFRKGMRFGIEIHYAPLKKETIDQTSLGLYFADGRVDKSLRMMAR